MSQKRATITIDGKSCSYEGNKTILQVAQENDIEIPHYCYHPGLSIVANCRICLAEIDVPNPRQDNKLERVPKLVPTCQQTASDGMVVDTQSPKSVANQKAVMEYLLINHPLDCPVCDQAGECFLQDYSYEYGRGESRFEEDKAKQPKKDLGPTVYLYSDRCIMCTRCVRFTREVAGTGELCVTGRGHTEEIDVFPGKALDNELSGNVVDICPVGALLDKDFLFEQRVWELTSTPSIDGTTASGDNIWIDHNEGTVHRLKPRANTQVNDYWISDEIRYGWKFIHDESRVRMPRIGTNGSQAEVYWPQAYNAMIDKLKAIVAGGGRLALLLSPMISSEDAWLLASAIRKIDSKAILGLGHVPMVGEDKKFPRGYTIRAEKAPNARGVRRAIEGLAGAGSLLDYDAFIRQAKSAGAQRGLILTGNYPKACWVKPELIDAAQGAFTVLIDTLANPLTDKADIVLPAATWAEKSGTFENVNNRLQAFNQAIQSIDYVNSEAQIGTDLLSLLEGRQPERYCASDTRKRMGGAFATEVHLPATKDVRQQDIQYVEI